MSYVELVARGHRPGDPMSAIPNTWLSDPTLTLDQLGIVLCLATYPHGTRHDLDELIETCFRVDDPAEIRAAVVGLETAGWVRLHEAAK